MCLSYLTLHVLENPLRGKKLLLDTKTRQTLLYLTVVTHC